MVFLRPLIDKVNWESYLRRACLPPIAAGALKKNGGPGPPLSLVNFVSNYSSSSLAMRLFVAR